MFFPAAQKSARVVWPQVCTAQGFTDSDPRYGFVTGRIFFGPNQKGTAGRSEPILGYDELLHFAGWKIPEIKGGLFIAGKS